MNVPVSQLKLNRDNLERVLMARLMDSPDVVQWPLHYLLACYTRASDEFRAASAIRDAATVQRVQESLLYSKQLIVSYSGLLLTMEMFPQVCSRLIPQHHPVMSHAMLLVKSC